MKDIYIGEQPPPPYWGWFMLALRGVTVLLGIALFALGLYEFLVAGVEAAPARDVPMAVKPLVWVFAGASFVMNGWPFLSWVRLRRLILVIMLLMLVLSSFFTFGAVQDAISQAFGWITYLWLLLTGLLFGNVLYNVTYENRTAD